MKFALTVCLVLAAGYIMSAAYLYVNQRSFIYFPSADVSHNHDIETFALDGHTIDVVVVNPGHSSALLYFGGNAENVSYNVPEFTEMFPALTLYLVNYRGYGGSSGVPTELGLYADADAIYRSVAMRHSTIAVMGKSLGTGVASYIASIHPVTKLALVTPYDSIANIASSQYPIFPISLLLKDRFDSVGRVDQISAHTFILLAESDESIPASHSANLIAAFPPTQISVTTINGTDHNSIADNAQYRAELASFFTPDPVN